MPEPTLRFAVGDPTGLSSNSWRIWTKPDGDVYIACRDNYKELKVSLHGQRWRVGVTDEAAKATRHLRPADADRAWMRWDRPESVGGITMGYRVLFLPSELAITPGLRPARLWRDVEFFPGTFEGRVTVATVTINEAGRQMAVAEPDGRPLDQQHRFLPLQNGGRVQATVHDEPLGEDFRRGMVAGYNEGRALTEAAKVEVPAEGRMFLVGTAGADGSPFATEVNYHRPDPDPLTRASRGQERGE